jgi:flagellar hook-associated protein FlgK
MTALTSTALSGLQAAQTRIQVAGHNLANLATGGYTRQQTVSREAPGGGVELSLSRAAAAGPDPAEDLVGLMQAEHAFKANLSVFRTHDRMMGALLDTRA